MTDFVIPCQKIIPKNAVKAGEQHKLCGRGIVILNDEPHASVAGFVHENAEKIWVNSFYRRYILLLYLHWFKGVIFQIFCTNG